MWSNVTTNCCLSSVCSGYPTVFIAYFVLQQFVWSYLRLIAAVRLPGSMYLAGERYLIAASVLHPHLAVVFNYAA